MNAAAFWRRLAVHAAAVGVATAALLALAGVSPGALLASPVRLLAWACAALALMLALHEALAQGLARGPQRRAAAIEPFARRLADGHFDQLLQPPPALWRDDELLGLRATLREVHEEHARLHRLLSLLRAAETDPDRRRALDALRRTLDADDHFAAADLQPLAAALPDRAAPVLPLLGGVAGALGVGLPGWLWPGGWAAPGAAVLVAVAAAALWRRWPSRAHGAAAGALAALAVVLAAGGWA